MAIARLLILSVAILNGNCPADDFVRLREQLASKISPPWVCGEITRMEVSDQKSRYFELIHPSYKAYQIMLQEKPAISQEEWASVFHRAKQAAERLANKNVEGTESYQLLQTATAALELPDGVFGGMGIKIVVIPPELAGVTKPGEKESIEEQKRLITSQLKLYEIQ